MTIFIGQLLVFRFWACSEPGGNVAVAGSTDAATQRGEFDAPNV
jgi:hypothetical protein